MLTTSESDPLSGVPTGPRPGWQTGDVARAAGVALAVWFGLQLLYSVSALVFLVFLATLFGLAVARGVDLLEKVKIRRGVGSTLIVLVALGVIGGGLAMSAPTLLEQGKELQTQFPASINKLQDWIDSKQRTGAIGALISAAAQTEATPAAPTTTSTSTTTSTPTTAAAPPGRATVAPVASPTPQTSSTPAARPSEAIKAKLLEGMSGASSYLLSFVSSTVEIIGGFIMLIFLVIFIGAEPDVYRGWMLAAVPAISRPKVRDVLSEVSNVLRKWLLTQMLAMVVMGVATTLMCMLLGVKAPFALGFIAGLLEFIPTVGPLLSMVPGVLMGFVDSPEKAGIVAVAYYGMQFVEGNLLIPYLMRGEMDLPPALTLVAQTLMTLVFGFFGLVVAVPLTAVLLVPLRMIAERENAHEEELMRFARRTSVMRTSMMRTSMMSIRETAEHALSRADRGPSLTDDDVPPATGS